MQVGLTIGDFDGKKAGELLALVRRVGVSFVELNPTVFNDLEAVIANMNGMAAGFHLPLVGEHGFDFSSLEAKERIDDTIALLNRHRHDLNLLYCVAHPPEADPAAENADEALEFLYDNLQRLEIPVILENVEAWNHKDFDRLVDMSRKVLKKKLIGLCFDPAHAFLRGEDIFARFSAIAQQVVCIHLSDCSRGHDAHLPLGRGELPIAKFLAHVNKHHFDGVINLEVVPKSMNDTLAVLDSYLQVLRVFRKGKFLATRMKLLLGRTQLATAH
ncbi:MAG: sugar phosphate isomerase/epimerase [candidate division KSB1 bacterium]|nr:sugar phosphate isomerase/epimerase [candidate division KSB1 bacterium]MDZ7276439.1 sugar phosphate isomerase/epimerase [candidate division KSB1 bacterium]MDZ7288109.1 sugar phosphate isomerase/epimerase [candidate division KSB1 bacterium]MDZ7300210.1 sugar phosphate isomerase/epimerase [candidate division KSB1 bacterium]MDZ7305781.1 sugar phosphate isomerase/epimerase [candidate division KSB1 bacterium]